MGEGVRAGYLHLIGGASGDMLLGALLDAGLSPHALEAQLACLGVPGFRIMAHAARRGGVQGTQASVELAPEAHRPLGWEEFRRLLMGSRLAPPVKDRALQVLTRLEQAERRAHRGVGEGLHELGSLDTLVDIVGVVAGLHLLGVERLYSSPLPMGSGVLSLRHGSMPAAAPATLEAASLARAPVLPPGGGALGELVTPTGAALITTLASFATPALRLERVGYGVGGQDLPDRPNVVALWLGEEVEGEEAALVALETNLDDAPPQLLGYLQERLLEAGALDVWFTPIQMKKNRPGVLVSVLVPVALEGQALALLLRETPTLGVRRRAVERHEAAREMVEVETPSFGPVPVKVKRWRGEVLGVSPEYEACKRIAQERGLPLQEVLQRAAWEARARLGGSP